MRLYICTYGEWVEIWRGEKSWSEKTRQTEEIENEFQYFGFLFSVVVGCCCCYYYYWGWMKFNTKVIFNKKIFWYLFDNSLNPPSHSSSSSSCFINCILGRIWENSWELTNKKTYFFWHSTTHVIFLQTYFLIWFHFTWKFSRESSEKNDSCFYIFHDWIQSDKARWCFDVFIHIINLILGLK